MLDDPIASAPAWRREPYRVLFPMGVAVGWCGVLHWLAFALHWSPHWRPVFHSIAQIQGFMTCFGVGFLFTAIPRRTGTAPPAAWEMALAIVAPIGVVAAAWVEALALSQVLWLALLAMLVVFVVRRFRSPAATRRPPDCFVWLPVALTIGLLGTALIAAYGIAGLDFRWHQLGRQMVLQGVFLGLVVGVGGMVLPLITRGEAPPDATAASRGVRWFHLVAAIFLVATFAVETWGAAATAYAARGLVVLAVLLAGARIWRLPDRPGWHRWLVWASAWAIPAGYAWAALQPQLAQAGLHTVFIGGFALMALSVGLHVSLAHGGRQDLVSGRPWQVPVVAAGVLAAGVCRALVTLDPDRLRLWVGAATAAFLLATLAWLWLALTPLVAGARRQ